MNYLKHYYNLVTRANRENRNYSESIYERHHVKPKCLGGKRLVLLTATEHYIAHFLLYKHFKKHGNKNQRIKMARAFYAMTMSGKNNIKRYTSKSFEIARLAFRESIRGENNPMYGLRGTDSPNYGKHCHSEEWKLNLSERWLLNHPYKGKKLSEEHKLKIGASGKGKLRSEETKKKMSEAFKGRVYSEETKKKMSEAKQNAPIKTCPYCNLQSKNASNMTRFHFDNCKNIERK